MMRPSGRGGDNLACVTLDGRKEYIGGAINVACRLMLRARRACAATASEASPAPTPDGSSAPRAVLVRRVAERPSEVAVERRQITEARLRCDRRNGRVAAAQPLRRASQSKIQEIPMRCRRYDLAERAQEVIPAHVRNGCQPNQVQRLIVMLVEP
jgi:hypothetical protein